MTDESDDGGGSAGADGDGDGDGGDHQPGTYSTRRYLTAKRSVDDRALAEGVLDRLRAAVPRSPAVLEVGTGVGAMVARTLEWGLFDGAVSYTAVDLDEDSVAAAKERLPAVARAAGYVVRRPNGDPTTPDMVFERSGSPDGPERLALTLRVADAATLAGVVRLEDAPEDDGVEESTGDDPDTLPLDHRATAVLTPGDGDPVRLPSGGYDLVVGAAFLDLVSWPVVEALTAAVRPGGHCYFPITFDGTTTFAPAPDPAFEGRLERAFHDHLDAGDGTSRAGRRALDRLPETDVEVVAAAGSDWSVAPLPGDADAEGEESADDGSESGGASDGSLGGLPVPGTEHYPEDEAYFLHHVVELLRGALGAEEPRAGAGAGDSESDAEPTTDLDPERVEEWARTRHRQVADGELRYLTHQVDVLGRRPESDGGT